MKILLKNGTVCDPKSKRCDKADVLIEGNRIVKIGTIPKEAGKVINIKGLTVYPGFIDLHAHFREPGYEYKEDLESGSNCAIAGGYTTVIIMPNTDPPLDERSSINFIIERSEQIGRTRILPIGCISKGRNGKDLAELIEMAHAGAVGFSDDGKWVVDGSVMRHALEYSKWLNCPIITHAEDPILAKGEIHECSLSFELGLKGRPRISEEIAVFRDISLAKITGGYLHVAHISSAGSVDLLKQAKQDYVNVTGEVTPHHLTFTVEKLKNFDTNYKVNPPIREESDRRALIWGLKNGIIDAIATDHAPHTVYEKDSDFLEAPPGIISIQWAFSQIYTFLVLKDELDLWTVLDALTWKPAKIIRKTNLGIIKEGGIADLTVIDLKKEWKLEESQILSKSQNTPLIGEKLSAKVCMTIASGKVFEFD